MPSSRSSPIALAPITSARNGRIRRQEELLHERGERLRVGRALGSLDDGHERRRASARTRAGASGGAAAAGAARGGRARRSPSAPPAARVVGEVGVDALEVVAERLDALERRARRRVRCGISRRPSASTSPVSTTSTPSSMLHAASRGPRRRARARAPASRRRRRCARVRGRSRMRSRIAPRLALGDEPAVDEHDDARRHPLDLVQHVRRDEHRAALRAEPPDQLDDVAALGGVESVERLVEQQQLGLVDERLGELDPLAHALREAADARARRRPRARRSRAPRPRRRAGRARRAARPSARPARARVRNGQRPSRSWTMPIRR